MRFKHLILFVLFIFAGYRIFAQPSFPDGNPVFIDSIIPRIDIFIEEDSLALIYAEVESFHEYPATFIFRAGEFRDTIQEVGFRLRGNTSRYSKKKSFKISFNAFVPGRKFYGLEKMNVNGEHNDPSVIRSKLCWDILRKLDVPASRANHVELFINGSYYGLYINVEHIDEEFAFSRFGNLNGNLYKCLWPADLIYFSDNVEDYKFTSGDRRTYDLHTNREEDNYDDLFHFIDVLNNTPDNELPCELEKVFNVDNYLKILAFDVIAGNWDDYSYLKNNYYLYHNTASGKFEFIPYDLDNTLGIDWIGRDWAIRDIYNWANHGEDRPLHKRILKIQKYKDQYSYYINKLITEIMDTTLYFPVINSMHAMISPYIKDDPLYPQDYGYSFNDFQRSYEESLGGHVTYGLKPYITTRIGATRANLKVNNIVPVINHVGSNTPRLGEAAVISALIFDDDPTTTAEVLYSVNDGPTQSGIMKDDGLQPDPVKGDNIFTASIEPVSTKSMISFQVRAYTPGGTETTEPCKGIEINIFESASPDLVINEFMAGNSLSKTDEFGEYDDWIEIYNRDPLPVWLGDKYLSDDLSNPSRWNLPDSILNPAEFILIWADGQNGQGPVHTNFRLGKSGEEIGIFESAERFSYVIDYLAFGIQEEDFSFGRKIDGENVWISFSSSTPGYSNLLSTTPILTEMSGEPVSAFPNPVTQGIIYFTQNTSVQLFDMSGRLFRESRKKQDLYVGDLPSGIYILKFSSGEVGRIIIQH